MIIMGKNLISRICEKVKKPVLIGASAATFAVMPYISGCENMTQEEATMWSLIGTMGMMSPNATPNDAMGFAGMRDVSQNSLNSINAEKSKTQVNVYSGQVAERLYSGGDIPGILYDERGIPNKPIPFQRQWIGWDNHLYGQLPGEKYLYVYDIKRTHTWLRSGYKVEDTGDKSLFPRLVVEKPIEH